MYLKSPLLFGVHISMVLVMRQYTFCPITSEQMPLNCMQNFQIGSRVTVNGLKTSQIQYFPEKVLLLMIIFTFIAKPGTSVDEVGLLIFACMYHLHVCIIMEDRCCTTQCEQDLDRCTVLLPTEVPLCLMILGQNVRSILYIPENHSQPQPHHQI